MIITVDVTEQQRGAVLRGEPVGLVLGELGDVVILPKDAYESLLDERERAAWMKLNQQALAQWGRDNPYGA